MKRLIIDGNNLVHRAFWVSKTQPVFDEHFHIHLFLSSVKNYVNQYKPDIVYCTWDEKEDYTVNKRKELLTEYKGNRDKERNLEVHSKNYIIKEMLETLGIKNILPRAYEADDVMAIFHYLYPNDKKTIVTVDKDMCQLIDTNTVVYDPIRKIEFNLNNFEEHVKCKRGDFVKIKALAGDKSDNIPGIKGFGKVKIAKYLAGEYKLTEEEQALFESNMKLVDLSLTLEDKDEVEYVKTQFDDKLEVNLDAFKQKCIDLKFHKFLRDFDTWNNIFVARAKLALAFDFFLH